MALRKILVIFLAGSLAMFGAMPAWAQGNATTYFVVTTCGTLPAGTTYTAGQARPPTIDVNGTVCGSATITPSGTQNVNQQQVNGATINVGTGAAGTGTQRVTTSTDSTIGTVTTVTSATVVQPTAANLNATVVGTGTFAVQSAVSPAARTLITLDVKTVTTGGTAVTALTAGHRNAGGFICNPVAATINLGINEIGTAAGTTSSGDTTFINPGQCYTLAPATTAVSVITSDSSHPFSGEGLN